MQQTSGIGQFYIPWLVAFYDTHKGKRWLNSNPPKPQGQITLSLKIEFNAQSKLTENGTAFRSAVVFLIVTKYLEYKFKFRDFNVLTSTNNKLLVYDDSYQIMANFIGQLLTLSVKVYFVI